MLTITPIGTVRNEIKTPICERLGPSCIERSYLSRVFSLSVRHRVPIPSVSAPRRF